MCKEYEGQSEVDEILLWDVIKMKIREASLNYAAARKRRLENRENQLEEEVLALENKLGERNVSDKVKENIRTELRIKKQLIEEIIAYKTQGAILRSKVKWYNEGEKNTKYFHNLEKRHFNSKTIRYLQSANGKKFSTDVEILDEAKNYYEHLYTTTSVDVSDYDNFFFPEVTETKLGNNQKKSCEGLLSATECLECLKTMESGKSPGTDGFQQNFIKFFGTICLPFYSLL